LMAVVFMAELSFKTSFPPECATPSTGASRQFNVYEIYIGSRPSASYWTDWGGWHDNPAAYKVDIYFGRFLSPVSSMRDLETTPNAIFIDGGCAFVNLPKHPWLYAASQTALRAARGWLSAPPDPLRPDNLFIDGHYFECRLEAPSVTSKLSDALSGIIKYSSFSFTLANDDGAFDAANGEGHFNVPARVCKAWRDNPAYADFVPLRQGIVENAAIGAASFSVDCADRRRTMEEDVCLRIGADSFPFPVGQDAYGKEIPVVYGTVEIDLIALGGGKYAAAEGASRLAGVYGEDDIPLAGGWTFDESAGTVAVADENKKAKWARTAGEPVSIGGIIVDIIARKSGLPYDNTNYDVEETDAYIQSSPLINIAFKGGDVKGAVNELLENDMAFLIQKNDGRFALRRWPAPRANHDAISYANHEAPSYMITQKIERDFKEAASRYLSSCVIAYSYNERLKTHGRSFVYRGAEEKAEERYHKLKTETFETRLASEADARSLAERIAERFSAVRETVRLAVGVDTSGWNLLDTVTMEMSVNGRVFSTHREWIIKELDNAQDKLTLEAVDGE
jgi:hypothetical protein